MIVVMWCCHVRRYLQVCYVMLRNALTACMLHGFCFGEEAGARNLVFFRVKWLRPAMKGTSCVRQLRLRSFWFLLCVLQRVVLPVCVGLCVSWICGCRSHCNGCMNVAWAMFWGGSRSTKPCVFPCKVAAASDDRYLVCAAVAAGRNNTLNVGWCVTLHNITIHSMKGGVRLYII